MALAVVAGAGAGRTRASSARRPGTPRRRPPRTPPAPGCRRSCWCRQGAVARGKLAQAIAAGAELREIEGTFEDAHVRGAAARRGGGLGERQLDQPRPDRGPGVRRARDRRAARRRAGRARIAVRRRREHDAHTCAASTRRRRRPRILSVQSASAPTRSRPRSGSSTPSTASRSKARRRSSRSATTSCSSGGRRSRGSRGSSASRPPRPGVAGVAQVRPGGPHRVRSDRPRAQGSGRGRAAVSVGAPGDLGEPRPRVRLRRGRARPLERGRGLGGRRPTARPGAHRHPRVRARRLAGGAVVRVDRPHPARARARLERGDDRARDGRGRGVDGAGALARGAARARRAARGPLGQPRRVPRRRRLPDLGRADRADRRLAPARRRRGHPAGEGADRRGAARAARRDLARRRRRSTSRGRRCSAPGSRRGTPSLLTAALADRLHEPYRPSAILDAVRAELPAGAVGATLSGSGPTVIVWADDPDDVRRRARAAVPRGDGAPARRLAARERTEAAWELELGEPYFAPFSKLVAPARLPDGTEAVLKVQRRDDVESVHEAEALRFWDGRGAVRLIDHDPGDARAVDRALRAGDAARRRSTTTRASRSSPR